MQCNSTRFAYRIRRESCRVCYIISHQQRELPPQNKDIVQFLEALLAEELHVRQIHFWNLYWISW